MKICDRCFKRNGTATMAQDEIVVKSEDTHVDLCIGCMDEIKFFIGKPDEFMRKPGRKKKENE